MLDQTARRSAHNRRAVHAFFLRASAPLRETSPLLARRARILCTVLCALCTFGCAAVQAKIAPSLQSEIETNVANRVEARVENRVKTTLKAEMRNDIKAEAQAAVGAYVDQSRRQITNELWPWIVGIIVVGCIAAAVAIVALVVIYRVRIKQIEADAAEDIAKAQHCHTGHGTDRTDGTDSSRPGAANIEGGQ